METGTGEGEYLGCHYAISELRAEISFLAMVFIQLALTRCSKRGCCKINVMIILREQYCPHESFSCVSMYLLG